MLRSIASFLVFQLSPFREVLTFQSLPSWFANCRGASRWWAQDGHVHLSLSALLSFAALALPFLCATFMALVGSNGLEPSTSRLSGVRSNHLSYEPISVAVSSCHSRPTCCCAVLFASRVPTCRSYSLQRVLPPAQLVVEMNRIELSTPCLQGRCSPS